MSLFSSMSYTLRLGSLLLGLSAPWVMADEAALYGPAAPYGSAFVRGFNAANSSFDANLGPVRINDLGAKSSSDFAFLPAGKYSVNADGQHCIADCAAFFAGYEPGHRYPPGVSPVAPAAPGVVWGITKPPLRAISQTAARIASPIRPHAECRQ